jgi:hypothetical protein
MKGGTAVLSPHEQTLDTIMRTNILKRQLSFDKKICPQILLTAKYVQIRFLLFPTIARIKYHRPVRGLTTVSWVCQINVFTKEK